MQKIKITKSGKLNLKLLDCPWTHGAQYLLPRVYLVCEVKFHIEYKNYCKLVFITHNLHRGLLCKRPYKYTSSTRYHPLCTALCLCDQFCNHQGLSVVHTQRFQHCIRDPQYSSSLQHIHRFPCTGLHKHRLLESASILVWK